MTSILMLDSMYLYCVSGKTDTDTDTTWPGSIIIIYFDTQRLIEQDMLNFE